MTSFTQQDIYMQSTTWIKNVLNTLTGHYTYIHLMNTTRDGIRTFIII